MRQGATLETLHSTRFLYQLRSSRSLHGGQRAVSHAQPSPKRLLEPVSVDMGTQDEAFMRHASVNRWRPMLEAGVAFYEYQPAMYHAKLISVDDRFASIGSTNLDNRLFRINQEGNLNVYDEEFARYVRLLVEEDLQQAERYDLERWENRPWRKRVAGWLSMLVGAHL